MRRIAAEPSKPLHQFNDGNTACEVCGKCWLAYLECSRKDCRPVYSPDNHSPKQSTKQHKRGGAGAWCNIYEGKRNDDGSSVAR